MDNLDELERQRAENKNDKDVGGNTEAKKKEISKMSVKF
jgi:hypothetical protein